MTCLAITEKKHGLDVKEYDEFDFMGDGVIFFDKRLRHELDPYPTYNLQIQKMRITKINEMPHPFIFTDRGLELIGANSLASRFTRPSSGKPLEPVKDENISSSGTI
jgi:KaiC/GvpD/RAD55 family RecA-like ATPase